MPALREILNYRRAVRQYIPENVPEEVIRHCVESAVLAPSSSNLQLWEYYHVTDSTKKEKLVKACMSQPAAKTAPDLMVVVTRHDKWKHRCQANLNAFRAMGLDDPEDKPIRAETYFTKTIPTLYTEFLGILGWFKAIFAFFVGLKRPMYREVFWSDLRVMGHKSVALSAQTFMLAMADQGYDTCPMEGIDSKRIKRILNLPKKAEINMVISCGKRDEGGIYGPRYRLPLDEVFFKV